MEEMLNSVEKAQKIISFRLNVIKACKREGIDAPSDEKIAEYIDQEYGMNVADFMADYKEQEGIFRTPLKEFKEKVLEYSWHNAPTEEEMREWTSKNGYDVEAFLRQRIIKSYNALEKATLLKTLELSDKCLVMLWNFFIEESARYGEDSYIYDLNDEFNVGFLRENMSKEQYEEAIKISNEKGTQFIQWFSLNDGNIVAKTDIKGIIIAYWGDIYDAIIANPYCYKDIEVDNHEDYFVEVFFEGLKTALPKET